MTYAFQMTKTTACRVVKRSCVGVLSRRWGNEDPLDAFMAAEGESAVEKNRIQQS